MSITQEAANLIATLAHAASQIGSTAASAKINQLIVSLISSTDDSAEAIAEALRQDNAALQLELAGTQKSAGIMAKNLALLRNKMVDIHQIASEALVAISDSNPNIADDLREIIDLATPIETAIEA
jgi:hypothetical protein